MSIDLYWFSIDKNQDKPLSDKDNDSYFRLYCLMIIFVTGRRETRPKIDLSVAVSICAMTFGAAWDGT